MPARSPPSALANAIGAVKAAARSQDATARGLLNRRFAPIDEPDRATGAWGGDVARLARAAIPPWWTWPLRSPRLALELGEIELGAAPNNELAI